MIVVDQSVVAREVVSYVKDEWGVYCDPGDTGQGHEDECGVEKDFVVPPNAALREE